MTAPETRRVLAALTAKGATVRFVGGCVRDAALARPVGDVDLATDAAPETNMALLKESGIRVVPTGLKHGTVTAVTPRRHFEITTLRVDVETFGRHAAVAFTDNWEADASRRDFTMNAMYADPDGTVYDPFGGLNDVRAGRVRFVGDARARIEEDLLRLLRFFRFYAHYGRVAPDADTLAACRTFAPRLFELSGERVRVEIFKLLMASDPADVISLMADEGILAYVLPEGRNIARLAALQRIEADDSGPDSLRRLAALLDTDRDGALAVAQRLRLSNAERDHLAALVAPPPAFVPPTGPDRSFGAQLYRLGPRLFADLVMLDLARLLVMGQDEPALVGAHRAALGAARKWKPVKFPLKGQDVIDAGVPAGPEVSRILAELENWWLADGLKAKRRECLKKLREWVAGG